MAIMPRMTTIAQNDDDKGEIIIMETRKESEEVWSS